MKEADWASSQQHAHDRGQQHHSEEGHDGGRHHRVRRWSRRNEGCHSDDSRGGTHRDQHAENDVLHDHDAGISRRDVGSEPIDAFAAGARPIAGGDEQLREPIARVQLVDGDHTPSASLHQASEAGRARRFSRRTPETHPGALLVDKLPNRQGGRDPGMTPGCGEPCDRTRPQQDARKDHERVEGAPWVLFRRGRTQSDGQADQREDADAEARERGDGQPPCTTLVPADILQKERQCARIAHAVSVAMVVGGSVCPVPWGLAGREAPSTIAGLCVTLRSDIAPSAHRVWRGLLSQLRPGAIYVVQRAGTEGSPELMRATPTQ